MELLQRLDQQIVQREPHRPAPVGIAAEQPGARFRRVIVHAVFPVVHLESVRMLAVVAGKRRGCRAATETPIRPASIAGSAAVCSASTMESRRRAPLPAVRMQAMFFVRSGRLSMNHSMRRLKRRQAVEKLRLQGLDGEQRNQAHHRAHLHGDGVAVGQMQARRNRNRLLRPTIPCRRGRCGSWRARCRRSAPRTCWPRPRRRGSRAPAPAQWPAGSA